MHPPPSQLLNMLHTLYGGSEQYTHQLGTTHQALSELYRNLAKIERTLAERHERALSRKAKKQLQYQRSMTKNNVKNLEAQQAYLHTLLQRCHGQIASSEHSLCIHRCASWANSSISPWTPFIPDLSTIYGPWTLATQQSCHIMSQHASPCWTPSSTLEIRRESSPFAASSDSGFHEPPMFGQPPGFHEAFGPSNATSHPERDGEDIETWARGSTPPRTHKRRHSVDAVPVYEARWTIPESRSRGNSVG